MPHYEDKIKKTFNNFQGSYLEKALPTWTQCLCECDFVLKCIYLYIPIYFCIRVHGNPLVMDPNSICRRTRTLVGRHADMCQSQPEIIQEVAKGARLGMRECQHQFHNHRWNCSSQSRNLAKILQQGEEQYKNSSWFLLLQLKLSWFSTRMKWMQSAFT